MAKSTYWPEISATTRIIYDSFISENNVGLDLKCIQCLQRTSLRQCSKCHLFICRQDVPTDEDSFQCDKAHEEECDLILQLQEAVYDFLKDDEKIDLRGKDQIRNER